MKNSSVFLLIVIFFLSCGKDPIDGEIVSTIESEILTFEPEEASDQLLQIFNDNEILIFGETHYVQEHQDFIVSLLPKLSEQGYTIVFEELFHSFNWMVEDYINGEIDELPEFILFFNETIIEGIKEFNSTAETSKKFRLVYMDVNQWTTNFTTSIEEIEKVLGTLSIFSGLQNIQIDSDAYLTSLQNIKGELQSENESYISDWGTKWYDRIYDMVSIEIESSKYRVNRNSQNREYVMEDIIISVIQANPEARAMVNTGMFHGQKLTYMGENFKRLGQLLQSFNSKTYSFAFVGMKGLTKDRFVDESNISFDLGQGASEDDVITVIQDLAQDQMSLTPLHNNIFSDQHLKISYTHATTITAPIGKQFDAIITYPQISTLRSMDIYDYQ